MEQVQGGRLIACLQERIATSTAHLLTTRLDSDDAIHPNFVQRLHQKGRLNSQRQVLNFPVGAILGNQRVYGYFNDCNPFISLLEPVDGFIGVFHDQFRDMKYHGQLLIPEYSSDLLETT